MFSDILRELIINDIKGQILTLGSTTKGVLFLGNTDTYLIDLDMVLVI